MNELFKRNYNLRYFEMNKHGMASPVTILTLLEETAAEHCLNIGYSLYDLEKQNIGWVLTSGVIEMLRYPKYKENITVLTWLSKYTLVRGYRQNLILDEDKNSCAINGGLDGCGISFLRIWTVRGVKRTNRIDKPEYIC